VRALGVDLGSRRIGVALSDSGGLVATPYEVIQRSGDAARDRRALLGLADEAGVEVIVVGLPLSLDGSVGPAARAALAEVDALRAATRVPVETYDERLTTVTAERSLQALAVRGPARRRVIDKVAAAVMLQAWLDGRRDGGTSAAGGDTRPLRDPGGGAPGEHRPAGDPTETTSETTPPRPPAARSGPDGDVPAPRPGGRARRPRRRR
jgi:putative Holliday junction resolvase